jgi:hypothetical protein
MTVGLVCYILYVDNKKLTCVVINFLLLHFFIYTSNGETWTRKNHNIPYV